MSATDRRSMLRLALAAAVAPALVSRPALADIAAGTNLGLIAPPSGQMRYHREVLRDMSAGGHMLVAREFAVEFRPFESGFMLHGQQLSATVDAPPQLQAFADLERARDESGLFPLALDAFGRLLTGGAVALRGSEIEHAMATALRDLSQQPINSQDSSELRQFINALHTAGQGVTTYMPLDLFAPAEAPRREERRIPLPTGQDGLVETTFNADRDNATGLMCDAEREVVTEFNGSRRRTVERWTLSAQ